MAPGSRLFVALLSAFTLIGSFALHPTPAGALSCGPCPGVVLEDLNLRDGPSTSDEVLLVMPAGAEIEWDTFEGEVDGFFAVTYDGESGWAYGDYLRLYPAFAATTDALNLREDASLNADVITVMPAGASVTVLGGPTNGFYNVRYNETSGYAHGDYLDFDQPSDGEFSVGDVVVVVDGPLNYRSDPNIEGDVIEVLNEGAEGAILDGPVYADGYSWYQLGLPGYGPDGETPGWVAGEFLASS